jgi:hypothetical protein
MDASGALSPDAACPGKIEYAPKRHLDQTDRYFRFVFSFVPGINIVA